MPAPLAIVPVAGAAGGSSAAVAFGTGFTVGSVASILSGNNPFWNKGKEVYRYINDRLLTVPIDEFKHHREALRYWPSERSYYYSTRKVAGQGSESSSAILNMANRKYNRIQQQYFIR